jgi:hypothetical protein
MTGWRSVGMVFVRMRDGLYASLGGWAIVEGRGTDNGLALVLMYPWEFWYSGSMAIGAELLESNYLAFTKALGSSS